MDMEFNTAGIFPLIAIIVVVALKFFSNKPRVDLFGEEEPVEPIDDSGEGELLNPMFPQPARVRRAVDHEKAENRKKITVPMTKPEAFPLSTTESTSVMQDEIRENGASEVNEIVDDFDLKKAVIMSEILTRKYNE